MPQFKSREEYERWKAERRTEQPSRATPAPGDAVPRPAQPTPERGVGKRGAGRIANGWALARQSWRVLMLDKELLLFPLLSGIACLLVLASFAVPLLLSGWVPREEEIAGEALTYVVLLAYYFANYFVIVFFNSALVACAMIRFDGGNPTVGDGLGAAAQRLPQIVAWAALAATVGVILKIIENRSEQIARIVAGLLGLAWSIATYFVVPVLVAEKLGPFQALRRSAEILKRAWGPAIVGNFGIGLIVFPGALLAVVPAVAGGLLAVQARSVGALLAGVGLSLVLALLVALIASTLNSILLAALYRYAATGKVPQAFDAARFKTAFVPKGA